MSIDGISTMGPGSFNGQGGAGAISELFPSFNAIEEIRIGETINSAEFGGVADVTTISKAGTNSVHGGAFENLQNNDMNASDFFSHTAPELKMNNFGIFMGGPVVFPKVYNGRDKTFFFGSFEALRLPKSTPVVESVPTTAMTRGDLSAYLGRMPILDDIPVIRFPPAKSAAIRKAAMALFFPAAELRAARRDCQQLPGQLQYSDQEQSGRCPHGSVRWHQAAVLCALHLQEQAGVFGTV